MALTLLELTTARDDLLRSRAQGIRAARDANGESIEYQSDAEMARALAALDSAIAAATSRPPSTNRFNTSKGL